MDDIYRRVILVTGIPRCGSTAVGQMLSLARHAGALHEPFNYHSGLQQINSYFEIPGTPSFAFQVFDQIMCGIKRLDLAFKLGVFPTDEGLRRIVKSIIGGRPLNSYRYLRFCPAVKTIIWKDPAACFTADYVSRHHDVDVLAILRNPWAVAASFKRMEWAFDLDDISARLGQIGIQTCNTLPSNNEQIHNSVISAAVLWSTIYSNLLKWAEMNPKLHVVNLDEIVRNPVLAYANIFQLLNLEWTERVSGKIATFYKTRFHSIEPKKKKAHDQHRDLRKVNDYWPQVLSKLESEFVSSLAAPQWERFKGQCVNLSLEFKSQWATRGH